MGKRSDFPRRPNDEYETPYKGVLPLIPMLSGVRTFAEPCAGPGLLLRHLRLFDLHCTYDGDIQQGRDALDQTAASMGHPDVIITNPPWTRALLYPLIRHFQRIAPTWLLFDADWQHNVQATPFLVHCSHVVSVGRLKWIANSKHSGGYDNAAWYRFHIQHTDGPRLVPRRRPLHNRKGEAS
ncbi:hypothetical protein [Mesorhizobium huakuii]|uniref:Class I SAM-dependent methyltransferase n=1 Tax=Mesorhizobium huakuii TaxID=28104 RepID=A0A7G6T0S4_9HYPH|nr:hypothetical protein [Mesorhizobium huakuii]QND60356.1 hypothetical protein HB778_30280 [Mesorhizobium huakuii]